MVVDIISTDYSLVAQYANAMRRDVVFPEAQEVLGETTQVAGFAFDTWANPLENMKINVEALMNDSHVLEQSAKGLDDEDTVLAESM